MKLLLVLILSVGSWFGLAYIADLRKGVVSKAVEYIFDKLSILGVFILLVISFSAIISFTAPSYVYSDGVKTGTLIKVTKKGFIFKTYEGQINLGGMVSNGDGGMVANIWSFSIKDEETFRKLQKYQDRRIRIYYEQFLWLPVQVGSTDYLVKDIKALK